MIYVIIVLGGQYAEAYCLANDLEQSTGRVYQAIARIIKASPLLARSARIAANKIEFISTGATITAVASDYSGFAGANPTAVCLDELWAYTSERSRRLFDEAVPVPTRKVSVRLTVTHAGFSGESELLESLYKRGMAGREIAPNLHRADDGLLMYWSHELRAPWQSEAWREQMRASLRPNQFLRMIENRWTSTESSFIELEAWDLCVNGEARPVPIDKALPVWIGVDASVKHDSTAVVVCTYDQMARKVRLVRHFVFQPSPDNPLDFEQTIEATLIDLAGRFLVRGVYFDPWQMVAVAQRLTKAGLPLIEFPQTTGNLTEASSNLFDLIRSSNLVLYPDPAMRLAASRAVAVESGRGWRIAKERASHKIDVIVALAQAALGAVKQIGNNRATIMDLDSFFAGSWGQQRRSPAAVIRGSEGAHAERIEADEV